MTIGIVYSVPFLNIIFVTVYINACIYAIYDEYIYITIMRYNHYCLPYTGPYELAVSVNYPALRII